MYNQQYILTKLKTSIKYSGGKYNQNLCNKIKLTFLSEGGIEREGQSGKKIYEEVIVKSTPNSMEGINPQIQTQ